MADFIPVVQTDTFDQWRIKTNQLGSDFAGLEGDVNEAIANIDLSSKADTNHTHVISNVTNLQNELDTLTAAINTNTTNISNRVSLTGNESITGTKTFADTIIADRGLTSNRGVSITGGESTDILNIDSGQMKLRGQDYTWPEYRGPGGRYLYTTAEGELEWRIVSADGGSVNLSTLVFNDIVPVGTIAPWAGVTPPGDGKWAFCNGQTLSSRTYSKLASVIGSKYGQQTADTITLPNFNGKVPVGAGSGFTVGTAHNTASAILNQTVAVTGGSVTLSGKTQYATLTAAQSGLPSHSHFTNFSNDIGIDSDGRGRGALYSGDPRNAGFPRSDYVNVFTDAAGGTGAAEGHRHDLTGITGNLTGASASFNASISTYQPYLVTQYIIKILPDDVQQVSIEAGNGINVKDQNLNDSVTLDLFSKSINVKVNTNHFKFSNSGLLELADNHHDIIEGSTVKLTRNSTVYPNNHTGGLLQLANNTSASSSKLSLDPEGILASEGLTIRSAYNKQLVLAQNNATQSATVARLTVQSDGKVTTPSTSISNITGSKQVTTKEYVDAQVASAVADVYSKSQVDTLIAAIPPQGEVAASRTATLRVGGSTHQRNFVDIPLTTSSNVNYMSISNGDTINLTSGTYRVSYQLEHKSQGGHIQGFEHRMLVTSGNLSTLFGTELIADGSTSYRSLNPVNRKLITTSGASFKFQARNNNGFKSTYFHDVRNVVFSVEKID